MSHAASEIREALQKLAGCETREDIGRVYADVVGYDISEEMPSACFETLETLTLGYLAEYARDEGLDFDSLFSESVSDEQRSNGPRRYLSR